MAYPYPFIFLLLNLQLRIFRFFLMQNPAESTQRPKAIISKAFKSMATKAILSLLLFALIYLTMIILSVILVLACTYAGIALLTIQLNYIIIMLGAGIISMAVLIAIFLTKFIFKKNKVDRSHLMEITEKDEPELFHFIGEIVKEVNTQFPKRIYISNDVNASVFYDSSFWSMVLPVKKNLQIGIGLVNVITAQEFKGILAHEFGHFSQRTMKVGSYVYNINQILYNLLYDNESFDNLVERWSNFNAIFAFFVGIAYKIVQGIQWILRKTYDILNISYMALSREMEFHADEVAANVAGSIPFSNSLLRMELADNAFNSVIGYYDNKVSEAVTTQNVYSQQQFVMNFLANENKLPFKNSLPQVSLSYLRQYNKSKLVIKDQWASHPDTEDRIKALEKYNAFSPLDDGKPAADLFKNFSELEAKVTSHMFAQVKYETPVSVTTDHEFIMDFTQKYAENSFEEIYNNYYYNKNPSIFDLDSDTSYLEKNQLQISKLFGEQSVELIYTSLALENDINTLKQIAERAINIKTFDYAGVRYKRKEAGLLVPKLESELEDAKKKILENDIAIYRYFYDLAKHKKLEEELKKHYSKYFKIDQDYDSYFAVYIKLVTATQFFYQVTPVEIIHKNLMELKPIEAEFKTILQTMLDTDVFEKGITPEIKEKLSLYLSKEWVYFIMGTYNNEALELFNESLSFFNVLLSKAIFKVKKELLTFQVGLYNEAVETEKG